jgi:hypothetical protein
VKAIYNRSIDNYRCGCDRSGQREVVEGQKRRSEKVGPFDTLIYNVVEK